jgi:hypothetical protein
VIANCDADPEMLQNIDAGLELAIAKLRSPGLAVPMKVEPLQSALKATHEQRRAVEQCLARSLEHDRLAAFAQLCGKECDSAKLRDKLQADLKRITELE